MVRRGASQRARVRTSSRHAPTAPPSPPKSDSPGGGGFPVMRGRETKSKSLTTEHMKGRLAIKVVTMNLSGQSVMGLTPAYKLNYIRWLYIIDTQFPFDQESLFREYVETIPDVVFIQDGIREEDLSNILEGASDGKYLYEFQVRD